MGSFAIHVPRDAHPDTEVVRRMLRAAPHRGTEIRVEVSGRAAVGVSTGDGLTDAWLTRLDGRVAAFVGTLDNLDDVVGLLERDARVQLPARDPAVVLLAAFDAWGDAAATRLRGVYTGAVAEGETVWVLRDHIGFRPLYYREDGSGFYAATEAKQVIAGAGIAREPDLEGIQGMLFGGRRNIGVRGVERFPSSSSGRVDRDGRLRLTRYWDPEELLETAKLTRGDATDRLRELMDRAVARTLSGNDAVALSGGIDSPTIAAFAAPHHLEVWGRPVTAVSAVFPHLPTVDELPYIELVRDKLQIPLTTYVPTAKPLDDAAFWADLLDGPVDTLSVPEIAEIAVRTREAGARRLLTGELFEYLICMRQYVIAHLVLHGRFRSARSRLQEERVRGTSWTSLVRANAVSLLPPRIALPYVRLRGRDIAAYPPWFDGDRVASPTRKALSVPARRRWLEAQIAPTGRGGTSPTIDANEIASAYHGIQTRMPLTDVDLWEFCLSLRAEVKFPNRIFKVLVRDAMEGLLPEEILWRRDKTGFDAHVIETAEWEDIRRWTVESKNRIDGIDYAILDTRLQRREMDSFELGRARDLARAHAFLSLWD